ncbi:MAG TPA: hypothetical protein VFP49_06065 [Nitrososphaeraceae archaeon]|nr:hypothetical protein [Nitrososphaeraceae archaeon]
MVEGSPTNDDAAYGLFLSFNSSATRFLDQLLQLLYLLIPYYVIFDYCLWIHL